jgi:hypothetical protein
MIKKRNIFFIITLLILIAPSLAITIDLKSSYVNRTSGAVKDYPNLQVTQLKYEPYPVEPGEYFTLWLKVKNIANEEASYVTIEIPNKYPFSIGGENKKTIGKLRPLEEYLVKFENIKVDSNALTGDHKLEVKLNRGGGYVTEIQTEVLKINIRSINQLLSTKIISIPEKIPQGRIATLKIKLKNLDATIVKNIIIKLNLPPQFVTIGSTNEKRINKLSPKEEKEVDFEIMALSYAESKAYSIPLELMYNDITGTLNSKNNTFGLLVGADIDYSLNIEEADTFTKNSRGKVVIGFSNTGPSEIKYSSIELLDSDDYLVLSNKKTYLGNLESDDFETSEFEIYVKSKKEEIPLQIKLEYKDTYNSKMEDYNQLNLKIYSKKEAIKYGLITQKNNVFNIILAILTIIFLYITFKNWKEERNIPKSMKLSLKTMLKSLFNFLKKLRWNYIKRIPRRIRLFLK